MKTDEPIAVRDATPADAEGIATTHIACWQEAYVDHLPEDFLADLSATFERRRQFWEDVASHPDRTRRCWWPISQVK